MEENANDSLASLNVDYDAGNILKETARWTRFLSIVGFVAVAIMLLALIFASSIITRLFVGMVPGFGAVAGILVFIAIAMLAVIGFMVYLLYRFSALVRKGIETQSQEMFNSGLGALRIYFVIAGVFAILSLLGNLSSLFRV
ncbi:MAG: hypothetical protein JST47_12480 [Bacteroidetes bacterium]|nr:hypothetical protein [Bacteroidota bacterium]